MSQQLIDVGAAGDLGMLYFDARLSAGNPTVEIRTPEQPWNRAWIAVFDHPYFTVADGAGKFVIEGLPPGTYTVKAWHERMERPAEQRVVVHPNGSAQLDLQLTLR